jgi:hypothetical protein
MNGQSESEFEFEAENSEAEPEDEAEDESLEADPEEPEDEAFYGLSEDESEGDGEDEADPEADTEDEGVDEAIQMSASARMQAQNRQQFWARRVATDQRRDQQRAIDTQRQITDRIRNIRIGGPPKVTSVGTLQGAGVVTAILPNGRRSRMRIIPTVAPVSEVNRLRSVVLTNEKRQAVATRVNSKAIANLAVAQAAAVKRLTDQQVKSDKDLGKRIVEGHNRLDSRITKELSGGSGMLDKHRKRMMRQLQRQRQRSLMNSVLLATSAPFFVAYGDRESPFAKNNLILTGSLLGFMLGDEALDWMSPKPGTMQNVAQWWSYLAPIGNGALVYWLLGDKQHERFITGINTIEGTKGEFIVDLPKDRIAKGSEADFKKETHVAVATAIGPAQSNIFIAAQFQDDGKLKLTTNPVSFPGNVQVMWFVDTKPQKKSA